MHMQTNVQTNSSSYVVPGQTQSALVNIDYLNFTLPAPPSAGPFEALEDARKMAGLFAPDLVPGEVESKGLHGYAWTMPLEIPDGEHKAIVAAGGKNHETVLYSFTGKLCGYIKYDVLEELLNELGGRITRVDLALDDLQGQYTVHEVREAYKNGEFRNRGQNPSSQLAGPWDSEELWGEGLAYYIGKIKNGKTLCVYEKGKQLGDKDSNWLRFEVRLARQDRDIPNDVLSSPEAYFHGAYKWLERLAELPGEFRGFVQREETQISIMHLVHHCRRSYGKVLFALRALGLDAEKVFSTVAVIGMPRRVDRNFLTDHVKQVVGEYLDRSKWAPIMAET